MLSEFELHAIAFRKEYARLPDEMSHERRVEWAERVANNAGLQVAFSQRGPVLIGPFEPADYLDDTKTKRGPVE